MVVSEIEILVIIAWINKWIACFMGFPSPSYLPTLLIKNIILLFGGVTVALLKIKKNYYLCCFIEDWHYRRQNIH